MRIAISLLMFLTGLGCVAYSYVGTMLRLAEDAGRSLGEGDEASAFALIIDFIMRGEVPQLTNYLYGGALLIVLAVVNLLLKPAKGSPPSDPG